MNRAKNNREERAFCCGRWPGVQRNECIGGGRACEAEEYCRMIAIIAIGKLHSDILYSSSTLRNGDWGRGFLVRLANEK